MAATKDQYDLLIVTDATISMGVFLKALNQSIPEILALSTMSGAFLRLGIIAYRDYDHTGHNIIEWSGWNPGNLSEFARDLKLTPGYDTPEAAKTGLIKVLDEVDGTRDTLVLWYADAPPHHPSRMPEPGRKETGNLEKEKSAFPDRSTDWMQLVYAAKEKKCTVFTFLDRYIADERCYYALLSQVTGGLCLEGSWHDSALVSKMTLNVLLSWMGNPPELETTKDDRATLYSYKTAPPDRIGNMTEIDSDDYLFRVGESDRQKSRSHLKEMISAPVSFTLDDIPQSKIQIDQTTLAKRFADPSEEDYRKAVYDSLASIINQNVVALTYNPVFGQLWRAVCKYRKPSAVPGEKSAIPKEREELVSQFSSQVSKIGDAAQQQAMKEWLENSYDSSEAIKEIIDAAPNLNSESTRWMYIDLDSFGEGGVNLTRVQLVDASRSCAPAVIAHLAKIFTHCQLVEPGVKLAPQQRSLPLSLKPLALFELMPHLVVPGVLFSSRPARIMALIATIVGVPFLLEPARAVLKRAKGSWVDVDVPENISYEFARLVLNGSPDDLAVRLTDEERNIYEGMTKYRLLELNLDGSLSAKVGWTPEKSREVGDDMVQCRRCGIKRSKTVMSNDSNLVDVCGLCVDADTNPKTAPETAEADSCWVECSVKTCRAQYVVLIPQDLRVRPKCWYCRNKISCPFIECTTCRNRIVLPESYRSGVDIKTYKCIACTTKLRQTIVAVDCTPRELVDENGVEWLGVKKTPETFTRRSALKLMQAQTPTFFTLSDPSTSASLALRSKPILDVPQVVEALFDRVKKGTVELATCTLCFESAPSEKLRPACGRSGCVHRLDVDCMKSWYGANKPGQLLNAMQLLCPFCRRAPTTKTIAKCNPQAAALGGLKDALEDRGFYFAWCGWCGFAKRAIERACCDGERLPNLRDFVCEECRTAEQRGPTLKESRFTACPTCGVMVEKTSGCNHITCACGNHFCHVCGFGGEEAEIYNHMNEAHGGIYDEAEDDGDGYYSD